MPVDILTSSRSMFITWYGFNNDDAAMQERPSRPAPDEARPSGDGNVLHADGRLLLPLPDAEPDLGDPDPKGAVPP